jgi:hypothetical protein
MGFLDDWPAAEPMVVKACRRLEHEGLARRDLKKARVQ